MKAQRLAAPRAAEQAPLVLQDVPGPRPGRREILVRVKACGICHTDLHIVEGDLPLPLLPVTPGHQIVGVVEETGADVTEIGKGERVGIPWLYATCGTCEYCRAGKENLCDNALFTGYHADGGFAEFMVVQEAFCYRLPSAFGDTSAAPLLCAGVIGFRAVRLSEVKPGETIGLYGFGASAHIALQIVKAWGCRVFVFTRSPRHRKLAEELGAAWTGTAGQNPPAPLHAAVIFAPAGGLVPGALGAVKKGGVVALAGIHMSPIPQLDYSLLYGERTLRSVANSTREDVRALLDLAATTPLRVEVETFPLRDANRALLALKKSEIQGSGVLVI